MEVVPLLLEAGASAHSALLIAASRHRHTDIAYLLLQAGAPASHAGEHVTPLAMQSAHGHVDLVNLLLQHGADPAQDGQALFKASDTGRSETIKLLFAARANLDNSKTCEDTPLMAACRQGHYRIIQLLLEAAADCNKATWVDTLTRLLAGQRSMVRDA